MEKDHGMCVDLEKNNSRCMTRAVFIAARFVMTVKMTNALEL